jgi:hypothetical protein
VSTIPRSAASSARRETLAGVEGKAADAAAYWLALGGTYVTFGFLWH